ncbi:hypothetical protein CRUP_028367, partial [Coryphaenoides rupestris]
FVKVLSFAALDREDLLCPINHSTLQRSSSWRTVAAADATGRLHGDDYIGIALPASVADMLHVTETPYFQKSLRPPAELPGVTEPHKAEPAAPADLVDGPLFSEWCSIAARHLEVIMAQGRLSSGTSGSNQSQCSGGSGHSGAELVLGTKSVPENGPFSGALLRKESQCSGGSGHSGAELVLGTKSVPENGPFSGALLRKEVLRLVVNLSSSVGMKGNQMKEKFPRAFDDVCLYSEICLLLAHTTFRLPARRFIQELFHDVAFLPLYEEAESVLSAKET